VFNQCLAVKLAPVCEELVKKLLLRDLILFKLHPGSGVLRSQQLLCLQTRTQAGRAARAENDGYAMHCCNADSMQQSRAQLHVAELAVAAAAAV
jgi:hypothetical protein